MGNNNGKVELTEEIVEEISRSSGIEKNQVRQQCEAFLVKHPSGQMDRKQFKDFIKLVLPKLNFRKMEKNIFRMYDTDQDGVISMSEFLIVFQILCGGTPEVLLGRIFRIFDIDNDGLISKTELKKLVKDLHAIIAGNNPEKYGDDLIADSAWHEMDKNRDGFITAEEFTRAVLAKDKFSKFLTVQLIDQFTQDSFEN